MDCCLIEKATIGQKKGMAHGKRGMALQEKGMAQRHSKGPRGNTRAFGYMGWVGMVSCIPDHLALEVFFELRCLSVQGIQG